jgi:hypothetical protein
LIGFLILLSGCESFHQRSEWRALPPFHEIKEPSVLDLLLSALSLERQDLGIQRPLPTMDPFLLNKVPDFLNHPLQTISFANDCVMAFNQGEKSLSSILNLSAGLMEKEINRFKKEKVPIPETFKSIPASPLRQAITILYTALVHGKKIFDEAWGNLNKEEIDFTKREIEFLLFSAQNIEKGLRYEHQARIEKTFYLASKIDRKRILEASYTIALALDEALKILSQIDQIQLNELLKEEKIVLHTPLGEIVIGGYGDSHYTGKMPLLLIDLGGNDQYHFEEYSPLSIIIDLSGNDKYYSSEKGYLGAGVMGIGFLIDLKGDDLYQGQNFAFGAGFLGVGFLLDSEGNDRYLSNMFTQGAGAIGLGILCDREGNDFYQTALYGQGFGFVGGGGFLLDYRGNDSFFAGGVIPDFRETSGAYQTLSQGFGFGIRPFASGGIGILYNGDGDDSYEGSYFSQGSAYWLSIGMLIDRKGNDRYKARRYSQGAGVHWAIGALIDYEGNDHYLSWGVSQGCGHDRSIGMLWDGQGDDAYHSEWLSQGAGNDSGRGLLIDEKGNDTYNAGVDGTQGCGKFDQRREEGSLGLLVDGDGDDTFSGQRKESTVWKSGKWGGGIDYKGHLPPIWKETSKKSFKMHISSSLKLRETKDGEQWKPFILPELESSLHTEGEWTKAAEALEKQGPSVIPSLLKYLEIRDVNVQGVLEKTFKSLGKNYITDIHSYLQKNEVDKEKKRFLLYVLGDIENKESKEIFLKYLNDEDSSLQSTALRGLYKMKETPSFKDTLRLSKSENMDVRRYLCLALQYDQNRKWIPLLKGLQNDNDFNVRFAASEALKAIQLWVTA